jgi:serine protease Do
MSAKVLGTAPDYDVALLQTEKRASATAAYLGDSDNIQIGDWVMAVGNPFGLSHSVSVCIISAKERRDISPSGRRGLYDFIQTDASINPGNSGGPLVNMRGEVIGINTAINAAGTGIGFAIPINMVKAMLPDLKTKGHYTKSWIGIKIQPLTAELAESFGLKTAQGALVAQIVPGSPADDAKLHEGDVVLEFDGKPVRNSADLPLYASMAGVGSKVRLKLWRNGGTRSVTVQLREFAQDDSALAQGSAKERNGELGITVADITPGLQRELSLEQSRGVVIKIVERGSPAARAGLQPGDVVVSLNGQRIETARQFAKGVNSVKSGGYLRLKVSRQRTRLFLGMRKP